MAKKDKKTALIQVRVTPEEKEKYRNNIDPEEIRKLINKKKK